MNQHFAPQPSLPGVRRPDGPDFISRLPFIGLREGVGEDHPLFGRDFWTVKQTGDYKIDCAAGAFFGEECIRAIHGDRFPPLLGWVVTDMIRAGAKSPTSLTEHDGLVIGFMTTIARNLR